MHAFDARMVGHYNKCSELRFLKEAYLFTIVH